MVTFPETNNDPLFLVVVVGRGGTAVFLRCSQSNQSKYIRQACEKPCDTRAQIISQRGF